MHEPWLILLPIGLAHILAVVSPGPSFILISRMAVARSRAEGVAAGIGMGVGATAWAAAVLLGLQGPIVRNPWVFDGLRLAGGLFFLYIGILVWRHAREPIAMADLGLSGPPEARRSLFSAFGQGLWVQVSNPKVAIFFGSIFVALLPADVPVWLLVALLVMVFVNDGGWYVLVAMLFSAQSPRAAYLRSKTVIDRIAGAILAGLGIKLLFDVVPSSRLGASP